MADVRKRLQSAGFLPAVALLLWWAIRLSVQSRVSFETGIAVGALAHFGLMLALLYVIDSQNVGVDSFLGRFKVNLKPVVVYVCLAAGSVGAFHHGIAREATALHRLKREQFIEQSLADEEAYQALQEEDPRLQAMDRDTAIQRAKESLAFQFNPWWHITASLLVLLTVGLVSTLFVSALGQVLHR